MFELSQIRQLLAIEQYGTLSRAAEALHLSPPALSRSMQRLEEELGVALFDRHRNRIEVNEAGRLAMAEGHKVMDAVASMNQMLHLYVQSQTTITIGSCAPAPIWELMPELTERYPDMTIASEMKATELLEEGLRAGTYQLVVLDHPLEEPGILCRPYVTERLYLSCPPVHPMAKREAIWLSDLVGQTMLLYSDLGIWTRLWKGKIEGIRFIVQNDRAALTDLINATVFPNFGSNLSFRHIAPPIDRVNIPILDPEATITFYLCARRQDKKLIDLIPDPPVEPDLPHFTHP
ncbi:MAG: LysR family transcriptional regulator, partial [Oscillospiraceae bacterium]|nr:LysR family transcriptional regulator [Oscillospiraceae bacterium]